MLLADRLDAIEYGEKRFLQQLGVSAEGLVTTTAKFWLGNSLSELFPSFLPHLVNILARSPRTHGPDIVRPEMRFYRTDGGAIARDYQRATALTTRQSGSCGDRLVNCGLVSVRGRCRH